MRTTLARPLAAAALALAALLPVGCTDEGQTAVAATSAPAASSPTPAPSPKPNDRATCNRVATAGGAFEFDGPTNYAIGLDAALSDDYSIRGAGLLLVEAGRNHDGGTNGNLAVAKAQLDLASACGAAFGDGPW